MPTRPDLGRAALEELYGGGWERASDRSAARDEPLTALVERHTDRLDWLGLSVDQIRTALRAYRVDRQLPEASKGKLLPASLRALAGVAELKVARKIGKASGDLVPDEVAALGEDEQAEVRARLLALQARVEACLAVVAA